jgi:A/G-specific adenine glycosylase
MDVLLKLWEGLGYYSRARNMKKAAIQVMTEYNGSFPNTYDALLSLPGIGPYTAGAIMSIAYNQPYSAIDGNVYRVMARYLGIEQSIKDKVVKQTIQTAVQSTMPSIESRLYTEGLMELGATICTPSNPRCAICPFVEQCVAYQKGLTHILPIKQKKRAKKNIDVTIIAFIHNGLIGIKKRQQALLNQLYTFETIEQTLTKKDLVNSYQKYGIESINELTQYTHVFTHLKWHITPYIVRTSNPVEQLTYVSLDEIENIYSLPKAYHNIIATIKKNQANA